MPNIVMFLHILVYICLFCCAILNWSIGENAEMQIQDGPQSLAGLWGQRWNKNPPEHVPVLRGWLKLGAVPEKDSRLGGWQGKGGGRSYR